MTEGRQSSPRGAEAPEKQGSGLLFVAAPLFFISGAAALVLETLWVRLFALSFGTTGLAMATVLTAYMTGLALGGALGGRVADRLRTPRRLLYAYAGIEAIIAVAAVAMPLLRGIAASTDTLFEGWFHGSLFLMSLGRFAVSLAVLLVPTTLMGATLPLLARGVTSFHREGRLAEQAGLLYAVNTFGAVVGAASAPFILFPALGLFGTGLAVAIADAGVALVAASLARFGGAREAKSFREKGSRWGGSLPEW